ncbi:MAG TPA: AMP-binding protein [Kofleriaceae bacterium]|nr:AMP-binding protein [Kofleriaceae bacterium]
MKKPPLIYDKALHEARKHWRAQLEAMSFEGHLAPDHPRAAEPQLASLEWVLDPEAHALLRRLTGGNPVLSYTALLLALQICCSMYSGSPRVTICSPGIEGAAANLLPIGATLERSATFRDALLATKDLLAEAYRHQQYPFSRMVLDLPEERRPKHLFMAASMAGLHGELAGARCDVVVRFEAAEARTGVTVQFDGRLYEATTIRSFLDAFGGILRRGLGGLGERGDLGDLATPISDLRPASTATAATAEAGAEDGAEDGAEAAHLHRLIEARAAEHPGRVAVVQRDRAITYEALVRDAARLAETLAELALDVRRPIVILMDAGAEMIAGMLAAMKIGAAFAPIKLLATKGPLPRILDALGAECILCQPGYLADLQQLGDGPGGVAHVIVAGRGAPADDGGGVPALEIERHGSAAGTRPRAAGGASAAGSDGRPGAACVIADDRDGDVSLSSVTHAELARLFQWLGRRCGIGSSDRCLLSPALGACEQLFDTLGMLIVGASVEIADAASLRDTALLAERLMAPEITVWDLPTALMLNLLPALRALHAKQDRRGPRNILLTGEKQCVRLADRLARAFPDARITGLYGNAAVGVWSTMFSWSDAPAAPGRAAIAQPIPGPGPGLGIDHRVVNGGGEPALLHTKGELYLSRAAASGPGAPPAAVKTGLRVELLEAGRMRWLRGDDHGFVKDGCRVELTEIEAALCEHEHVVAAEVLAVSPQPAGERRVVAFVLADAEQVSAEAVRDFLGSRGEVDLVPDHCILVDELPLTAAGAIDRDALLRRLGASRGPEALARSVELEQLQRRLRGIWLEILQLEDVADDDSFFARGGNSLRATLLIARVADELSVELSVQQFFREPSIRAVAQLIAAEARSSADPPRGAELAAVSREKYRVQMPDVDR